MQNLLEKIKKAITPAKEERKKLISVANEIIEKLSSLGLEAKLLGSVAKDTFLKGQSDLDIFVFFPKSLPKEEMASALFSALERLGITYEKKYAEHPYARIVIKGINADVVPAYKTSPGEVISAVDRSYWHYEYISKHLKEGQKGEVRLLKKFLKNLGLYGAEAYRRGFSGYLCELLIIHYGSFVDALKAFSKWKPPIRIYLREPLAEFNAPLVVIDPVDGKRNVAAVVSLENIAKLSLFSRAFLKKPSDIFFFISRLRKAMPIKEGITISFPSPRVVEEIRLSQLNRIREGLSHWLSQYTSISMSISYEKEGRSIIAIATEENIDKLVLKKGPYVWDAKSSQRFLSKHIKDRPFLIEDRLYVVKPLPFKSLEEAANHYLSTHPLPSHFKDKPFKIEPIVMDDEVENELKRAYIALRWAYD